MFGISLKTAEQFFHGLRLDKSNKMDLLDLDCKPYKLNRYLYKPIIIWNIDGCDYSFLGKNSCVEAMIQYTRNSTPWGKAPEEWMQNECFKNYVHRKEDDHDKWLDDKVEEIIQKIGPQCDRNVKYLRSENSNISIEVTGLGEIDFIIIAESLKKVFIADQTFKITQEEDDKNTIMNVGYPYFKKPEYVAIDPFSEE